MGGPLTPLFDRWYNLMDGYRAYLAQTSPADYHKFNDIRNSIAASTLQDLLGRLHLREIDVEMDSDLDHSDPVSSSEDVESPDLGDDEIDNERWAIANSESENQDEPEQEQQFGNISYARRHFNRVPDSPLEEEELDDLLMWIGEEWNESLGEPFFDEQMP
ncbi:hypothetical protein DID88_006974 [Monilinia fructigena]|uniref:Uncharacterized protein n=1 Tax=Monilinia fructigena TaxID=38457 RepID=A0A395IGA6_9HELO|nr:hypothetical protein DID88_006974 [Monilinia fructigena]